MFLKLGENFSLTPSDVQSESSVLSDPEIHDRFVRFAKELKKVAPKANDFLYFTTRFITAAEASLINEDGSAKLDRQGKPLSAHWEKVGESLKWVCSDPTVEFFSNSNGDVFSEEELIKSHKKWIGTVLAQDHKAQSVDGIRGIILDTYYDRKHKCGVALCALDKKNFPELARKVEAGYLLGVSMGTAVAEAQCLIPTCLKIAKSDREFCEHMRTKTTKELNRNLSPLEISLVVSPADRTAKIRTIFASYQGLKSKYSASDTSQKVQELQTDLKEATEKLAELEDLIKQEETSENSGQINPNLPYGAASGDLNPPNSEPNTQSFPLNVPTRYADIQALLGELQILKSSMTETLKELSNPSNKQEDIMSDTKDMNKSAYHQGGGGVNEPTPGKPKYPKDPMNEQLREKEDKQMVGQSPFPGVGDVDGLHPSPASADDKNELERKKKLLRAEQRQAALKKAKENIMNVKQGYWQGAGGVNEPTPGKVKYPIDPLGGQLREKEDKQMVGQKPFPDVGDVDGLHPSPASAEVKDELQRKKMLARASLKARFVKAANTDGTENVEDSAWQVYLKNEDGGPEKLVFTASVDEISGGRSDVLYDVIATKEFGSKMLEKVRSVGLEKAASIYKKSQAVAGPGAAPGLPPDATGANPMPAMDMAPPAATAEPATEDKGSAGDPKEAALKMAETVRDNASDLLEMVRDLTGSQAEMGELEKGISALPEGQAGDLKAAANMRRDLHDMLVSAGKKALNELKTRHSELKLIAEMSDSDTVKNASINSLIKQSFDEVETALVDANDTLRAYQDYADGVESLHERVKSANEMSSTDKSDSSSANDSNFGLDMAPEILNIDDVNLHDDTAMDLETSPHDEMKEEMDGDFEDEADKEDEIEMSDLDKEMMDVNDTMVDVPAGQPLPPGSKAVDPKMASVDLTTKEGRLAWRAKLAKDLGTSEDATKIKFNPILDEADRLSNGQTKLDTKPSDNLGLVETLPEVNKRMLEVAKAPPKVKKEADRLNQMIVSGAVKKEELDALVAEGLDSEVVKYWKDFYGQADGGKDFAALLTTETMKAKAEEELQAHKVKLARSYDLANEMVRKGLLANTHEAIARQVEESMQWNDAGFDSMKRVVASTSVPTYKQASAMPQVGVIGSGDVYSSVPQVDDFQSELDSLWGSKRNGRY